jgi:quinol monooxygenase YgiN
LGFISSPSASTLQHLVNLIILSIMAIDMIAVITPAPGSEATVEEVLNTLAVAVKGKEPGTLKYVPHKTVAEDGTVEFVITERHVNIT